MVFSFICRILNITREVTALPVTEVTGRNVMMSFQGNE